MEKKRGGGGGRGRGRGEQSGPPSGRQQHQGGAQRGRPYQQGRDPPPRQQQPYQGGSQGENQGRQWQSSQDRGTDNQGFQQSDTRHQGRGNYQQGRPYPEPGSRGQHFHQGPHQQSRPLTSSTSQQAWPQVSAPPPTQSAPAWGKKAESSAAPPTQPSVPAVDASQPTLTEAKPTGKKKGKGKVQETKKPSTSDAPPPPSSSAVDNLVKKTEKLALKTYALPTSDQIPKHTQFLKTIEIEVNYLPIKIKNPNLKIYHYDVTFNPDKPKYLLRPALEEFRNRHFGDRHPAFDGKKNLYVAGRPLREIRDSVTIMNNETGKDKEFDIGIKLVNDKLNIARLFEYCNRGITSNIPQTEIQATDIALRSGLTPEFTPVGRSFFAKPNYQPVNLGSGMELWNGFYQSAIMAKIPYLNIDVANKAFPTEQTILEFMRSNLGCTNDTFKIGLDQYQRRDLEQFIKGLKIEYEMPGVTVQKRIYKVTGLGGSPIDERFQPKEEGPMISVGLYYSREKKYEIRYPKLPLVKIGTKGSMVPIELCKIIGNQVVMRKLDEQQTASMVKAAARPTTERKQRIIASINRANYPENPTLREFGIEVQTSFEKITAVVMKPPKIAYKKFEVDVKEGVWRLDRDNFLTASEIPAWIVLNLNQRTQNKVPDLERMVMQTGSALGMIVPPPHQNIMVNRINEQGLVDYLVKFGQQGIRLVFVILPHFGEIYGQVKRASELRAGVLTQCIKSKTVERINPMTVTNILLKVNSKLRGVNHSIAPTMIPDVLKEPYMLVGADVTHPSPGPESDNTPSIAAVAASHDRYGFQYKMLYRLQPSRQEMIIDLMEIMKAHLESFHKRIGRFPKKILYFRDGVSEGQFQEVLSVELEAIRRAWLLTNREDQQPKITFVVVQKRHHTRFFPNARDGDRKNCNVPAGTLVDTKITHPTEIDFYLVSHQSIQGTARPTKYHLLWDDCKIPQVELEKLTYYLCHMFSRCTRSVSYPAPTYYAHLAAFRARAWWDRMGVNMEQLEMEQRERGAISVKITDNYPMFFV